MNAEIIAVGSEMLTPERVDTNSLYLTRQLNNLGVEVIAKGVIGDDRELLAAAIHAALVRCSIVILTGGLGPTEDDVTREAVAQALGRGMSESSEALVALERRFEQARRKMAEVNRRQAYVIDGAELLPNGRGTAPGQWLREGDAAIMLLPGPPHEMKGMFEEECLPRLKRLVPPVVIRTRVLRVIGIGESDLDQAISPIYRKYSNPVTTVLAANGEIQVWFRARCASEDEAEAQLAEVSTPIEAMLGDRVYSLADEPLEQVVGSLLRAAGATLAVAESCTGGMLGERITAVAGSSDYFVGGYITYSEAAKQATLGVRAETLAKYGAVSSETTEEMAAGARERSGATYAVAITGIAGPGPGLGPDNREIPAGTVFMALAGPNGARAGHRVFLSDRQHNRVFAAQFALDLLRRELLRLP